MESNWLKKIMIKQTAVVTQEKFSEMISISPSAFCVNKNIVWIMHYKLNMFFKYDLVERKTEYVGEFPGEEKESVNLFYNIFCFKNKVVFLPWAAKKIWIYHVDTKELSCIDSQGIDNSCFVSGYLDNGFLYCMPYQCQNIVKLDLEEEKICEQVEMSSIGTTTNDILNKCVLHDDILYGVSESLTDKVIIVGKNVIQMQDLYKTNSRYSNGCYADGKLILYDKSNKKVNAFKINDLCQPPECMLTEVEDECRWLNSICKKWVIQECVSLSDRWIIENKVRIPLPCDEEEKQIIDGPHSFALTYDMDRATFYYDRRNNHLYEIHEDSTYTEHFIQIDKRELQSLCKSQRTLSELNSENEILDLGVFLQEIENG